MNSTPENDLSKQKINILLIDDDGEECFFFAEALKSLNLNYNLSMANDCMELFDLLDLREVFNVIFLDINMPIKNGKECLKEIKSYKKFSHIPVIIFTVSQYQKDIDDTYNSGAHYFVIKPDSKDKYVSTLKTIFDIDWTKSQP